MKIDSIRSTPIRIRRTILLTTSYGRNAESNTVLVEVRADDGLTGYGMTTSAAPWYGDSIEDIVAHLDRYLAPAMIGRDPLNIVDAVKHLDRVRAGALYAKSALEHALWDLKGKALGVPVYQLLGGRAQDGIHLHGFAHYGAPDEMADGARAEATAGWTVLKMKIGVDPAGDLARYRAVREAVGDRATFQLDGNTGYTLVQAVPTLTEMVRLGGVGIVEQPVRTLDEMAELGRRLAVPLMIDESINRPEDVIEIAQRRAGHVLHMKLHKFGGLLKAHRIASVAHAAGIVLSVAPYTDVELAAAAHFAAAMPHATWPAGYTPMEDSILTEPIVPTGQRVLPPDRPGFGVEIDAERVAALAVR
jgi:L-Ala-D/L-Glu epimerase / N-acetyl-D-glutamate racemase